MGQVLSLALRIPGISQLRALLVSLWPMLKSQLQNNLIGGSLVVTVASALSQILVQLLSSLYGSFKKHARDQALCSFRISESKDVTAMRLWIEEMHADTQLSEVSIKKNRHKDFQHPGRYNSPHLSYDMAPRVRSQLQVQYEGRTIWVSFKLKGSPSGSGGGGGRQSNGGKNVAAMGREVAANIAGVFTSEGEVDLESAKPNQLEVNVVCWGGIYGGGAQKAVWRLLADAQELYQKAMNKFCKFHVSGIAGENLERWLRDQPEMYEDPEWDVAAANEGAEKADTTELDPRTARLVRRGKMPMPRGIPTEMTAPALVTGAATSETGEDTVVFKARESASAKVCHNGKVLYVDPVSSESGGGSKHSYVVWIAQPYGSVGTGVTKEDAIAMVRELCALGRAKLDKDDAEKQWTTYRFPQGSRAAKFFNIWLDKTTHIDEDIAKATAVTVSMKSAEGAPPRDRADLRIRSRDRGYSSASTHPPGTQRKPTSWSFKPDSKSTISTQVDYKGDGIQVLVQKSEGSKDSYSDEYPPEGAGSQDIQVYVRSLDKDVMRQILTEGEKLEQGRVGRRTTVVS
jgi:hypothetical protein